jgi:hypothetical protein
MRLSLFHLLGGFSLMGSMAALAQSQNISPKDFDFACGIASGAEMGASQNDQNIPRRDMALTLFTFYLGRLSGRDNDATDWNAVLRGRVAELQEQARSQKLLDACESFYISKIK